MSPGKAAPALLWTPGVAGRDQPGSSSPSAGCDGGTQRLGVAPRSAFWGVAPRCHIVPWCWGHACGVAASAKGRGLASMAPRCDLGVSWGLPEGCVCAQRVAMTKPFAGVVVAACPPLVSSTPRLGSVGLWGCVTPRSACTCAHGQGTKGTGYLGRASRCGWDRAKQHSRCVTRVRGH